MFYILTSLSDLLSSSFFVYTNLKAARVLVTCRLNFFVLFCLMVLGIECRAWSMLSKDFTTAVAHSPLSLCQVICLIFLLPSIFYGVERKSIFSCDEHGQMGSFLHTLIFQECKVIRMIAKYPSPKYWSLINVVFSCHLCFFGTSSL